VGLVPGTGPTNSNKFEFVGLVAGTKFWSLRLHFLTKMGSAHEGNWSPGLVAGASPLVCADLKSLNVPAEPPRTKLYWVGFTPGFLYAIVPHLVFQISTSKIQAFNEKKGKTERDMDKNPPHCPPLDQKASGLWERDWARHFCDITAGSGDVRPRDRSIHWFRSAFAWLIEWVALVSSDKKSVFLLYKVRFIEGVRFKCSL